MGFLPIAAPSRERALHAGSSSANTLTRATTTQPSAISARLVARKVASAFALVFSSRSENKAIEQRERNHDRDDDEFRDQ